MKTLKQITEFLNDTDDNTLVQAWNDYQRESSLDRELNTFDEEFFSIYFTDPMEAARATFFGKIQSWNDDYIYFNGYGNLESTSRPLDVVDIDELADYINDNQQDFDYIINHIDDIDEDEDEETE